MGAGEIEAPGAELLGPLSPELQSYIAYSAGVGTAANEAEAAKTLINFLKAPAAVPVLKAKGMEPTHHCVVAAHLIVEPDDALTKGAAMRSRYAVCLVGFLLASCQSVTPRTWELPAGVKSVQVNGYEMAYVERGTGVPVVLVHGLLADYRYWVFQMQSFGSSYRTISISLRHFYPERWTGEGNDFSIRQHAEDLASFIEQSSAGPVHLVAHSRGTDVALRMAKTHPALVRSMVLVDPAPLDSLLPKTPASDAIMAGRKDQLTRTLEQYQRGAIDQGLEIFVDLAVEPDTYKNAPAPLKQVWRDNAWSIKNLLVDAQEPFSCADASRLDVPVLLVTGEQSPPIYGLMLNALQSCLPRKEKATIPNASHAMARTHPGPFNTTVLAFFARN